MKEFKIFLVVLVSSLIAAFIYAAILMWLWNAIVVGLFSAPIISYWQAFSLYIISNILFNKTNTGGNLRDKN